MRVNRFRAETAGKWDECEGRRERDEIVERPNLTSDQCRFMISGRMTVRGAE